MKLQEIISGFKKSFWVANIMELFERLAYYGQLAILAVFLKDELKFSVNEVGSLTSIFGGLIYFLPIFAGAIADKIGFKKSFTIAFSVLALGYFLIGSTGIAPFSSFYTKENLYPVLVVILVFTAMGGSFIKPSVLGTISLTSSHETKSIGYAIYYWLVNIGGAVGPFVALLVRQSIGIEKVYLVSAISCGLMLLSTIFIFKEPETIGGDNEPKKSFKQVFVDLVLVLKNFRFIVFLLIFSLFWLMFWQNYIIVPLFITDFISKDAPFEIISSAGAWGIIALQLPVNFLTKRLKPTTAIVTGFAIASLTWFIILLNPTIPMFIAGVVVLSIGEMTQAPRYYEYIADLAPKGQTALFQGYSFLPIAIGWLLGGNLGGWLYDNYGKSADTAHVIFIVLFGIGVLATLLMWAYTVYINKRPTIK
ncbi:MAG TPA: MFS transporter [Ignavibacteriaceae bacterium]|nr:MFS transporter [Ignavibacteriaceae bacterium]